MSCFSYIKCAIQYFQESSFARLFHMTYCQAILHVGNKNTIVIRYIIIVMFTTEIFIAGKLRTGSVPICLFPWTDT